MKVDLQDPSNTIALDKLDGGSAFQFSSDRSPTTVNVKVSLRDSLITALEAVTRLEGDTAYINPSTGELYFCDSNRDVIYVKTKIVGDK